MPQQEQCQVCWKKEDRAKLVRKLMPFSLPAGENYLLYTRYNSDFWIIDTSTEVGTVSMGLFADNYRPRVADVQTGNSSTEARGSYTVTNTGTLRSIVATDVSALTNLLFELHVGAYHAQSVQALTVVLGLCDGDGANKTATRSWSFSGQQKCWFTLPVADIASPLVSSGVYVYATVTISGENDWWIDGMQLEDATTPSTFLPITSGTAYVSTTNTSSWKIPILCPECARERILKPSERYGNYRKNDWVEIREEIEEL